MVDGRQRKKRERDGHGSLINNEWHDGVSGSRVVPHRNKWDEMRIMIRNKYAMTGGKGHERRRL